jgi:dihydroxy-acid dehydratase
MFAERLDGSVTLAGCDKSLPGMLMAAARLDLASVFLYAGSTLPGKLKGPDGDDRDLTIIDVFEGVGRSPAASSPRRSSTRSSGRPAPGRAPAAACTPPTPWPAPERRSACRCPAVPHRRRSTPAVTSTPSPRGGGRPARDAGTTARQILTKQAFENAITVVMALGGSTNAVLHLLAIAHEARVDLTYGDFSRIATKVPHLADVKPFGRYVMTDVDRVGGIPVVMKALLDVGLLHGDTLTCTGRTMAENLEALDIPPLDGEVLRALGNPMHRTGGISILHGSLAPRARS